MSLRPLWTVVQGGLHALQSERPCLKKTKQTFFLIFRKYKYFVIWRKIQIYSQSSRREGEWEREEKMERANNYFIVFHE